MTTSDHNNLRQSNAFWQAIDRRIDDRVARATNAIRLPEGTYAGAIRVDRAGRITQATPGGVALTWTCSKAWGAPRENAGGYIYVMDVDRRLSGRGNGGIGFYANIPPGEAEGARAAFNVYVSPDNATWTSIFEDNTPPDHTLPFVTGTSNILDGTGVFRTEATLLPQTPTPTAHPTAFGYIPQGWYVRLDIELYDTEVDEDDAIGDLAQF